MTDEIKLGDLELRGSDLAQAFCYPENSQKVMDIELLNACAVEVNRILREKLAKAPIIGGVECQAYGSINWNEPVIQKRTHTARLILIEEVGK